MSEPADKTPQTGGPQGDGKAPARPRGPQGPGPGGPGGHALTQPTAKAKDFKGTMRRLAGELKPDRTLLLLS